MKKKRLAPSQEAIDHFIFCAVQGSPQELQTWFDAYPDDIHLLLHGRLSRDGHTTAAGFAAACGNARNLKLLLRKGAPYDIYAACVLDDRASVKRFLEAEPTLVHARAPHATCERLTELAVSPRILTLLEKKGAPIDVHVLARHGLHKRLKALLSKAPHVINDRNIFGNSPLHVSLEWEHYEATRILLEHGADPNSAGMNGATPLMDLLNTPLEIVRLLISKGADIHARSPLGMTPLIFAALHGRRDVVELLLELGARDDLTSTISGHTAAEEIRSLGRGDFVDLILRHNGG